MIQGSFFFFFLGLLLATTTTTTTTHAAVLPFDVLLYPANDVVQYIDGYVRAPGAQIDMSDLTFRAVSEAMEFYEDDLFDQDDYGGRRHDRQLLAAATEAEAASTSSANTTTTSSSSSSSSTTATTTSMQRHRHLDGGIEKDAFYVDIAIFKLPSSCVKNSKTTCDWANLGVGKRSPDGDLQWCCSDESMSLGLCTREENIFGRLLIDETKFEGFVRLITVPHEGSMSKKIRYPVIDEDKSGTYVVLFANCNPEGRQVEITGNFIFKSKHGYLPGELFGFMLFYKLVTFVYVGLFVWFAYLMVRNQEYRVDIEKWILLAVVMGLVEMIFRSLDYTVWNKSGQRSQSVIWIGIFMGVLKQGFSFVLVLMVSKGWGLICDTLEEIGAIVGLGASYMAVGATIDCMIVFAAEHVNSLSASEEREFIGVIDILRFARTVLVIVFFFCIFHALGKTTSYLDNMNEKQKLARMQQLKKIILCSILFAFGWAVFSYFDYSKEGGIVQEEHAWAKDAASEVNYLFVLFGIAYLWQPNESARSYAYFQQLSPMADDDYDNVCVTADDFEESESDTELELSEYHG